MFIVLALTGAAYGKYSGGGTAGDPYLIATPEDLNSVGLNSGDWDNHFKLIADINMAGITGSQYNVIGYYNSSSDNHEFSGVFDGNGHSILNFTYEAGGEQQRALISYLDDDGLVQNVRMVNPKVHITSANTAASLVAYMRGGTVQDCRVEGGQVSTDGYYAGGLIGFAFDGTIYRCSARDVNVSCDIECGGLLGRAHVFAEVAECFADCTVVGDQAVGGLFGAGDALIERCYALGSVKGSSETGGFVGKGYEVRGCYDCFAAALVDCSGPDCGGFEGDYYAGAVVNCFWDVEASDCNVGDGGTGLPTAEMRMRSTFADAGWDMVNVWDIGENQTYPFLRKHRGSDINKDDETDFLDLAVLAENWLETVF